MLRLGGLGEGAWVPDNTVEAPSSPGRLPPDILYVGEGKGSICSKLPLRLVSQQWEAIRSDAPKLVRQYCSATPTLHPQFSSSLPPSQMPRCPTDQHSNPSTQQLWVNLGLTRSGAAAQCQRCWCGSAAGAVDTSAIETAKRCLDGVPAGDTQGEPGTGTQSKQTS